MAASKSATPAVTRSVTERVITRARVQGSLVQDAFRVSTVVVGAVDQRLQETLPQRSAAAAADELARLGL